MRRVGIVTDIQRRNNSINGNPRFTLSIQVLGKDGGELKTVRTKTDSSFGLEAKNLKEGDLVSFAVDPGNWVSWLEQLCGNTSDKGVRCRKPKWHREPTHWGWDDEGLDTVWREITLPGRKS